jgi:hypothetical protein
MLLIHVFPSRRPQPRARNAAPNKANGNSAAIARARAAAQLANPRARTLTSLRAVQQTTCYVLANGKKQIAEYRNLTAPKAIDLFRSALGLDG